MATVQDMISRVRSSFKLIAADNVISNRVVADELKSAAIKLIKQQTDKRRLFSSDNIFTHIDCLEMQAVPLAECCDYKDPCMIARSKLKLPRIAENIYGPLVQGVYSINGKVRFDYADADRYANLLKMYPNKKGLRYWWIHNNYLYVTDSLIEEVNVSPFFEDFVDARDYGCGNSLECPTNPLDMEFKCPGYLEADVVNMARDMIQRDYKRSIDDKTVNNNDESR